MSSSDSKNRGYAFLVLMVMVTVLLISLTAAVPSIYTEGQREKEEELIFRGNQYAHAILLFHRNFGRWPNSIDEIAKRTNGIRYLRKTFTDPMTLNGKWRLIHIDARGILFDSRTMPMMGGARNQRPQTPGANPMGDSTVNPSGEQKDGGSNGDQRDGNSSGGQKDGNSSGVSNQVMGAFIIGVASTSGKPSIRIYHDRTRYDEWEFMANGQNLSVGPGQQPNPSNPGQGQIPGQNSGPGPGQTGPGQTGPGFGPGPGGGEPTDIPPLTDEPNPQQ